MKVRGSKLVVRALADEKVRFTFGIPGTHNIEIYDALADAPGIEPVLVTSELAAAFLADGLSRTSSEVGVLMVVPGAGVTHALSGIAEAYLDQVPLVVIACGIRTDTGAAYQLHDIDQLAILRPVTKAAWRADEADDIYPLIRLAFQRARRPPCGPVAVEVPANLLMLHHELPELTVPVEPDPDVEPEPGILDRAAALLASASRPALYLGLGAAGAGEGLVELAERLAAPVTTTFQGKGVFPESHPLWLWSGFGRQAPPFVRRVMEPCDALLAIGCRFGEVATGSYGIDPPEKLIHVDIDVDVFHRNYRAAIAVRSDAAVAVDGLLERLEPRPRRLRLEERIADGHRQIENRRESTSSRRVTPGALFRGLRRHCREDAIYTADSGNGTFLAIEHLRLDGPNRFIAPVDYSCMGYSVPAAIGAAFANPGTDVVALAGDGAFLMTGLELLTAVANRRAPLVCVLRDGKLGQIAQFQKVPLNRQTCTVLPRFDVGDIASAIGAAHFRMGRDRDVDAVLSDALAETRSGRPALVDVAIDVSETTYFTRGVLATNLRRFPAVERTRMIGRALGRRLLPWR